jgi:hypothetical protein
MRLLIPMKSILWKKFFGPLYSEWPKKSWPMMKRSLGQTIFFCYFRYFWKDYNKSQGYFCWKCKKVENQHTLLPMAMMSANLYSLFFRYMNFENKDEKNVVIKKGFKQLYIYRHGVFNTRILHVRLIKLSPYLSSKFIPKLIICLLQITFVVCL